MLVIAEREDVSPRLPAPKDLAAQILLALIAGPQRMQALCLTTGQTSKRVYRQIMVLRHIGAIRRLGVKGSTFWALLSYHGPRPRIDHPTISPRRDTRRPLPGGRRVTDPLPKPVPQAESWWLQPDHASFSQAAHHRAKMMGWDD